MTKDPVIVVPPGMWRRLHDYLFDSSRDERFAMGVARPVARDSRNVSVLDHLIFLPPNAYQRQSSGGLSLTQQASARLNHVAAGLASRGQAAVHIHSHPHGMHDFSALDDEREAALHAWLRARNQPWLWSLVWPQLGSPRLRLWSGGSARLAGLQVGLRPLYRLEVAELEALDRQRAFGNELKIASSRLRVGIIGVGGIGMLVAEQLARCGFRDFLLIDRDRVEKTNLNRLPNAKESDVGRHKVFVAKSLVKNAAKSIGNKAVVVVRRQDIYAARNTLRRELSACDIVLALTDNQLSRISCLGIALESGAEYLQAAVDIRLDDRNHVRGLFAEVTGAESGRYCPICTGRLDPGKASIEVRKYMKGRDYTGIDVETHAKRYGYIPDVADPSVMSLNSIAAGALVLEIQCRIAGLALWDIWQLDFQNGKVFAERNIDQKLRGACGVCGRDEVEVWLESDISFQDEICRHDQE